MPGTAHPEQIYSDILSAHYSGSKIAHSANFFTPPSIAHVLDGLGSINIPQIQLLCCLHYGTPANIKLARQAFITLCHTEESAFMFTELLSPIYGTWHLAAKAGAAAWALTNNDRELYNTLESWLHNYFALHSMLCTPDFNRIVAPGLRAGGHTADARIWDSWIYAHASSNQSSTSGTVQWEARGRQAKLGMKQSWLWALFHDPIVTTVLRDSFANVSSSMLFTSSLWKPLEIVRRAVVDESGKMLELAVWLEGGNPNGNTTAWGAQVWRVQSLRTTDEEHTTDVLTMPANGGHRIRQQAEQMTMTYYPPTRTLSYHSNLQESTYVTLTEGGEIITRIS